jgi:hypothetical protein
MQVQHLAVRSPLVVYSLQNHPRTVRGRIKMKTIIRMCKLVDGKGYINVQARLDHPIFATALPHAPSSLLVSIHKTDARRMSRAVPCAYPRVRRV